MWRLLLPTHPAKRYAISCCRGRQTGFVPDPTILHFVLRISIFGIAVRDSVPRIQDDG